MGPIASRYSVVVFLFAFAMVTAFRMLLPADAQSNESTDYRVLYEPLARNLAAGAGYRMPDGTLSLAVPPGFPLYLAGIFTIARLSGMSEEFALSIATAICIGLTSVLVFRIARQVWGDRSALGVALIFSTYPLLLWMTKQPNSEVPFLLPLYGAVLVILRELLSDQLRIRLAVCAGAGALAGIAALFRPIAVGFGVVLAVVVWLSRLVMERRRPALLPALVILVGYLVAVSPWEAWIFAKTGRFVVLSTTATTGILDGLTYAAPAPDRAYLVITFPQPPSAVVGLTERFKADRATLQSTPAIAMRLFDEARSQPGPVAQLLLLKAVRSWYGTYSGRRETAILGLQLVYLLLLGLAGIACWKIGERARLLLVCTGVGLLYFWAMAFVALSTARYMVPAIGLMLTTTGALLTFLDNSAGSPRC